MVRRRVLILADTWPVSRDLEKRVTGFGYDVAARVVETGAATLPPALPVPDLILVALPLRVGSEAPSVAAAFRGDRPVPVLYVGPSQERAGVEARAAEPWVFVATPVDERALAVNIELAICKGDQKRAVHELEGFFSISRDLFCFLDFSGHFRRLNPAWERTLGFTLEELMARPFIDFVHPDDRERTLGQNGRVRAGGHAVEFENRYVCTDGSYRWLLWNSAPSASGGIIYAVARDVTARKLADEERARLVFDLEASLAEVQSLREILPICSYCRKIRDDEDYWHTVEGYFARHTRTRFSHGICPDCMETVVEAEFGR